MITPRLVMFASGFLLLTIVSAASQDTPMQDYIDAFSGRWVCEMEADQDIEGYTKKGEKVRTVNVFTPLPDGSGMRQQWHLEKDGDVRGRANMFITWDAAEETLRMFGSATGGFLLQGTDAKADDQWHSASTVTFPDGTKASSKAVASFSNDGNTYTVVVSDRVSHTGEKLGDQTHVWHRAGINQGMPKHVSRSFNKIIGDWKMEFSSGGVVRESELVVEWAVPETVLRFSWSGIDPQTGKPGSSIGMLGWHPTKKMVVEYEIGTDGFTSEGTHQIARDGTWVSPIRGTTSNENGTVVSYEYHRTFSFKSKDEWIVTGEGFMDGKPVATQTSTFRRKK